MTAKKDIPTKDREVLGRSCVTYAGSKKTSFDFHVECMPTAPVPRLAVVGTVELVNSTKPDLTCEKTTQEV